MTSQERRNSLQTISLKEKTEGPRLTNNQQLLTRTVFKRR